MGKNKMDVKVVGTGKGRFHGVKRKELKLIIRRHEATISNQKSSLTLLKKQELSWRQQFDTEVYYKKQAEEKAVRQALKIVQLEQRIEELELALDSLGNNKATYIGEVPDNVVMRNDGQLVEKQDDPYAIGNKVNLEGHEYTVTGNLSKPADVDEAVEWAKRNGHHFPNGKPDKDRMKEVVIPSAEEISQENREKYTEILIDPMFDEKGKSHQSID